MDWNKDKGDCVPKEGKTKCNKDCGVGWCLKEDDTEQCFCSESFEEDTETKKCILKKEICASGELTKNNEKCKCSGHFKYAKNGITCEPKAMCADEKVNKECRNKNAKCVDWWQTESLQGYDCKCEDGYQSEFNGICTDHCNRISQKEHCNSKGKVCTMDQQKKGQCLCPLFFIENENGKCDSFDKYSYVLSKLPVLSSPYENPIMKHIDYVKMNADIIQAMKAAYSDHLEYAYLSNYEKKSKSIVSATVALQFKDHDDVLLEVNRIKANALIKSGLKCKGCDDDKAFLPPSLLIDKSEMVKVQIDRVNLCSEVVKNQVCGKEAKCGEKGCYCSQGYKISDVGIKNVTGKTILRCEDVDECVTGIAECSDHSTCVNTPGDYYCQCDTSYKKKNETLPLTNAKNKVECVDMCTPNPCDKGKCSLSKDGLFDCSCDPGFGGPLCNRADVNFSKATKQTVVVGAVLGTILGVLLLLSLFYIRRLKKKGGSEDFSPAIQSGDASEMMERRPPMRGISNKGFQ